MVIQSRPYGGMSKRKLYGRFILSYTLSVTCLLSGDGVVDAWWLGAGVVDGPLFGVSCDVHLYGVSSMVVKTAGEEKGYGHGHSSGQARTIQSRAPLNAMSKD